MVVNLVGGQAARRRLGKIEAKILAASGSRRADAASGGGKLRNGFGGAGAATESGLSTDDATELCGSGDGIVSVAKVA